MGIKQFDPPDTFVTIPHAFAGFVLTGHASFSAFTVSLSEHIGDFGSVAVSLAGLILVLGWVIVYATNDNDNIPSMSDSWYGYLVAGGFLASGALAFSPDVASFIASQHDVISVGVPLLITSSLSAAGWER